MAYAVAGQGVIPLLKAWGIHTEGLREVTIHVVYDDVVTVEATYIPKIDIPELMGEMKRYILCEVKEDEEETDTKT
jgi:hypothetical protein